MKSDQQKNRRPWTQFSLKTVLVLMLIVAAYFAGRVPQQRRARLAERRLKEQTEQALMAEKEALISAEQALMAAHEARNQAENARYQAQITRAEAAMLKAKINSGR